jgi:hypothetical protein
VVGVAVVKRLRQVRREGQRVDHSSILELR